MFRKIFSLGRLIVVVIMSPMVRISEIGLYLRCPRLVYFQNLGSMPVAEDTGSMLLRSLMQSLSSAPSWEVSEVDLHSLLSENLSRLEQELPLVYEIDAADLNSACRDLEEHLDAISQGLARYLDRLLPCEVDIDLRSEKLGLSGRLDRMVSKAVPSLIRTGKAPQEGIWKRDRIMLSGYALLLGEREKRHIEIGMVEYARAGLVRTVEIHGIDRARVLRIRDRVRLIKQGRLPDRPENAPCQGCRAAETCQTRHSLASKFF